ncbi:MAG: PrsW family intramembrane metalloprotease [Micromonosporaceae bacterium]|nr:PrsW family intramembrane metalloprotease [Micromonosporaceae bacterium]
MSAQPPAAPPFGTPPPAAPARRSRTRRGLQIGAAITVIAACAIAVLGLIGWNIGPAALAVGLAAAIIPVPVLVLVFLWLDRYEPEPIHYLILCFAWGAFSATLLALGVNFAAAELVGLPDALVAVLVAPVVEEIGKAAFPLLLVVFRTRVLSGITDGIVYCGLSATGFAMVENILYLGGVGFRAGLDEFGPATGLFMLIVIFLSRVFMSGFAHPLFTSASGVGIGLAARASSGAVRRLAPIVGLLVAMALHASWNLMAVLSSETGQPLFFLYGYVAVMMPVFLGMVGLAIWLRAREGQVTQRTLPDYVRAGWLSPPEVAALGTLGARHSARRWARRVAGEPGARAMRGFQFTATRLALLRDGVQRGLDSRPAELARVAAEEQELLRQISAHRQVYVGRDPAVPSARWDGLRYEIRFPDGSARLVAPPAEPVLPLPVPLPAPSPAPVPPPPPPPDPYRYYR